MRGPTASGVGHLPPTPAKTTGPCCRKRRRATIAFFGWSGGPEIKVRCHHHEGLTTQSGTAGSTEYFQTNTTHKAFSGNWRIQNLFTLLLNLGASTITRSFKARTRRGICSASRIKPLVWEKDRGDSSRMLLPKPCSRLLGMPSHFAVTRDWEKYREFVFWAPYVVRHDGTYHVRLRRRRDTHPLSHSPADLA